MASEGKKVFEKIVIVVLLVSYALFCWFVLLRCEHSEELGGILWQVSVSLVDS